MEGIREDIDEHILQDLYAWVDKIPLSRPKRNLCRDFSDGVLMAEVVAHYHPKMVDIHNYSPANSTKQKMDNWRVLNRKVFRKLDFELSDDVLTQISNSKPQVIERVLLLVRSKLEHSQLPADAIAVANSASDASVSSAAHGFGYAAGEALQSPTLSPSQPLYYSAPYGHNVHNVAPKGPDPASNGSPRKEAAKAGGPKNAVQHKPMLARPSFGGPTMILSNGSGGASTTSKKPQASVAAAQTQHAKNSGPIQHGIGDQGGASGAPKSMGIAAAAASHAQADVIPRIMYEEKEQQCLAQEETIQILQAKVRRLEHLLQLKDVRIGDLQVQLDGMRIQPLPGGAIRR